MIRLPHLPSFVSPPGRASLGVVSAALAFAIYLPDPANGATVRVPADYPTIQDAIDAAGAADTVLVAPGTYSGLGNEGIGFGGVDRVLRSEGGAEVTRIEASSRAFLLGASLSRSTVIEGFTIRGGAGSCGGGVASFDGASPTIQDCVFRECYAGAVGGAICLGESTALIQRCRFEGNRAFSPIGPASRGGAIYTLNSEVEVRECVFLGNQTEAGESGAPFGAAIYGSRLLIEDCVFSGNRGNGTLYIGTSTVRRCTLAGNSSGIVAAGSNSDLEQLILWNCGYDLIVGGVATLSCSIVAENGITGDGAVIDGGGWVHEDPLLCSPVDCGDLPSVEGDYFLQPESPAWAENNECGADLGAPVGTCAVSGTAELAEGSRGEVLLGLPVPNPTSGAFQITLSLAGPGPVELSVLSVTGAFVARTRRELPAGVSQIELDLRGDLGGPRLPTGRYFLRARTVEGTQSRPILLLGPRRSGTTSAR